jgi:hypothetical protein
MAKESVQNNKKDMALKLIPSTKKLQTEELVYSLILKFILMLIKASVVNDANTKNKIP